MLDVNIARMRVRTVPHSAPCHPLTREVPIAYNHCIRLQGGPLLPAIAAKRTGVNFPAWSAARAAAVVGPWQRLHLEDLCGEADVLQQAKPLRKRLQVAQHLRTEKQRQLQRDGSRHEQPALAPMHTTHWQDTP